MAVINNYDNHSTIQIRKDIYFVFGSLNSDKDIPERIKSAITEMRRYFSVIGEEAPDVVMNWKIAQEGDWVLSDDYRVVQILKRTENNVKGAYNKAIIRTCVATFAVNDGTFFDTDFDAHADRYRVSNTGKEVAQRMIERENITNNERIFAQRIAKGESAEDAYIKTFPTKNKIYAKEMSRLLLKQERIQENISSEVEELLKEEGVSKRYIIQQYKQLVDDGMADLRYCSGSVVRALDSLVDISGMKPDKTKSSSSVGVLEEVKDGHLKEIESAEFSVVNNNKENFEQEYEDAEDNEEEDIRMVGNNLLVKSGLDLIS